MIKVNFFNVLLFVILLNFWTENSYAAIESDSLLLLIKKENNNKRKVDLYNEVAQLYTDTAFSLAQQYTQLAYQLATKIQYPLGEAMSLYYKGRSLALNNQFEASLVPLEKAITIIKKVPDAKGKEAQFMKVEGRVYFEMGNYVPAIELYIKAFELYDSLENDKGKASTLLNIGTVHSRVGDKETALEYYQKARAVNERLGNISSLVYCINNIGAIHNYKKDYMTSLSYYQQALKLAKEAKLYQMNSYILKHIGENYYELNDLENAIVYFKKAREIALKLEDEIILANLDIIMAKAEFHQSKKITSISALQNAYQTGLKYDALELQQISAYTLSEMYVHQGLYEKAYEYKILEIEIDSIRFNDKVQEQVHSLEIKKQLASKQKELNQEKREALLEVSLANQTKVRNMLLFFLGLLSLAAVLLYRAYKNTYTIKEQLLVKNKALEKAEEQLAQKNKDLHSYIDLNVELEQFAAIASHDIKAPLSTIAGFIGILKNKFYNGAEEKEKNYFDFVEKSAKSLNLLVKDLLEFSRSSSKTLNIRRIALETVLEEVIQNLDFSITQANAKINLTDCNLYIHADQIKIKQILQNLLSNALKFRAENRAPIIQVRAWEDSNFLHIEIEDNGIGISEENFDEVFQKFARINNNGEFEGSGLGLSIVANYIKRHQGEISIKRNEIFGVTFTFTIKKSLHLTVLTDTETKSSSYEKKARLIRNQFG